VTGTGNVVSTGRQGAPKPGNGVVLDLIGADGDVGDGEFARY
jgi:hypothetical protein